MVRIGKLMQTANEYRCRSCSHRASKGTWGGVAFLLLFSMLPVGSVIVSYSLESNLIASAFAVGLWGWAAWQGRRIVVFERSHPQLEG